MIRLELAFEKRSLRQLCEKESRAIRDLGERVANKLKRRLADLRAATCVNDLKAGRPRKFERDHDHYIQVELGEGFRMVFCANHINIPLLESGGVDWAKVTRVKILKIERSHG